MRGFISAALPPMREADAKATADGRLLAETARHLAVRMSYEDVIRVAQAKIDPARFARIAKDMGIKPDQTFAITEFLKPGVEEFCSVLPPWLAKRILAFAEGHAGFGGAHWGMAINTASLSGFLRFYVLASLRGFRPRTWRFKEEQRNIENWLRLITRAAPLSVELAIEIAECARLIKGYGDTHKRGSDNYRQIVSQVIEPALAGQIAVRAGSRCDCQRAHGGIARSGRRGADQMPRRDRLAAGPRHRRRVVRGIRRNKAAAGLLFWYRGSYAGIAMAKTRHKPAQQRSVRRKSIRRGSSRRWSARVTRESDALDLKRGVFARPRSQAHCRIAETLGGAQPPAQVGSLPIRPIDAHVLYQSRRQEPTRRTAQDAATRQDRIAQAVRA